jgi:hypothetical protein
MAVSIRVGDVSKTFLDGQGRMRTVLDGVSLAGAGRQCVRVVWG